jgi:transcriptional regulator with XRE-family HTH domain
MTDSKFLIGLGEKIREIRQKKKMTQNELALQCEFEKASMSRIESGKTNVTILTLKKISQALQTDLTEFFKD